MEVILCSPSNCRSKAFEGEAGDESARPAMSGDLTGGGADAVGAHSGQLLERNIDPGTRSRRAQMDVHSAGDVIALVPLVDTIHGCSGPQLQRHFAPGWPDSDDIPKAVHGRIGKGRFVRSQWWTNRRLLSTP